MNSGEVELVNACFKKFYNLNRSKLIRIIPRNEFTQECWIKFLRSHFDKSRSSLTTYSYLVARNCYCNLLKTFYARRNPIPFIESVEDLTVLDEKFSTYIDTSDLYRDEHITKLHNVVLGRPQIPAKIVYELLESGRNIAEMQQYLKENIGIEVSRQRLDLWIEKVRNKLCPITVV